MKPIILLLLALSAISPSFAQELKSFYVKMDDGIHLAADVHFPKDYNNEKLPVLVQFERYWRSSVTKKHPRDSVRLYGRDKYFNDNGYIIVIVDTRGTGASFGTRESEYSPRQVMDATALLDWVVAQPWSDGNIGAYGTSYTGTTAELLCATKHPSIKAVIPGWSDFDLYRSPARPYGLLASTFIRKWGMYVRLLDRNRSMILKSSILPVEEDSMKAVLSDHKKNVKVFKMTRENEFRNSGYNGLDYEKCSAVHWQKEIEESNVPMLVLTSWMDAGTAEGTIQRLEHFSNPQKVLLMATAHGGWCNASPFEVKDSLRYPKPRMRAQNKTQLDFFDHYLKGIDKRVEEWPLVSYYNLGEEKYRQTDVWPIPGTVETNFYFGENNSLSSELPEGKDGFDAYKVDFGVYTSKKNRWTTQMGGAVLNLDDRGEMDERMLVYTSAPVLEDVQITGTPVVNLQLSSTHKDGAVLVYLEDVDENGKSTYITEGGLRLIHRKEAKKEPGQYNLHTFNEEDAMPMIPGQVENVKFKLWPISVRVKKGHSIRIAIAGADKSTFDRFPKHGTPTLKVYRNQEKRSFVTFPVVRE